MKILRRACDELLIDGQFVQPAHQERRDRLVCVIEGSASAQVYFGGPGFDVGFGAPYYEDRYYRYYDEPYYG